MVMVPGFMLGFGQRKGSYNTYQLLQLGRGSLELLPRKFMTSKAASNGF